MSWVDVIRNSWDSWVSYEPKTVSQLLKEIGRDRKINWWDVSQLEELEILFNQDSSEIYQETKEGLQKLLQESLLKGYSINNENDYNALNSVLKLLWKDYILPDYNELLARFWWFSVKYENEQLKLYNLQNLRWIIHEDWSFEAISLFSAFFSTDNDWHENNNTISTYNLRRIAETIEASIEPEISAEVWGESSEGIELAQAPEPQPQPEIEGGEVAQAPENQNIQDAIAYNRRYNSEQAKLIQEGVWLSGSEVDGKIWSKTIEAIKKFQSENWLTPDGKVWPLTLWKIQWDWYGYKIENGRIIPHSSEDTILTPSFSVDNQEQLTTQEAVIDTLTYDLSKWVTIWSQAWYEKLRNTSWWKLPEWNDLPEEIKSPKSWDILTLLEKGGKIHVYFGQKRENDMGQQYVMKYGEILQGKFEKSSFFTRNSSWDDLGNNSRID